MTNQITDVSLHNTCLVEESINILKLSNHYSNKGVIIKSTEMIKIIETQLQKFRSEIKNDQRNSIWDLGKKINEDLNDNFYDNYSCG